MKHPALEVVDTAANGRIALARLAQLNPDVVILDVKMPVMDGLTTLKGPGSLTVSVRSWES